ncbi:MAG: DUF58 domain-containing protein [Lachnospiraceae bacterium]|nr:DUF58 domain-containing protein [Lachnospiraceae bacterium]
MNKSRRVGFTSALLVNKYVIAISFALSLIAWWLGADALAVLLLTLSALGLMSLLWGMYSLKDLDVMVQTESCVLSVGRSVRAEYIIENNKLLPLVWLEICQEVPVNSCLTPDGSMSLREFSAEEAEYSGLAKAYMRRFAFLMGHREIAWDCEWTGTARGVYRPGKMIVRSGDGFGLTQSVSEKDCFKGKTFVVWPRIVPVNAELLLKNIWSGHTGKSGYTEDISVLRDEREYRHGDSWKRIDWRMAARSDELYTKQFEMIRPQMLLLIVETAGLSDPEEALSIAASLLWELSAKGISVGLALPATQEKDSVLLRPDDPGVSLEDCLFELADHKVSVHSAGIFNIRGILSAAEEAGQIWILGESRNEILNGKLAQSLRSVSPGLICASEEGAGLSFDRIRRKTA